MSNGEKQENKQHCYAFCPECGSDLYFYNEECFCKKDDCDWHCKC